MSESLAIAAVTTALRNLLAAQVPLLDDATAGLDVTTRPPDAAHSSMAAPSLNLFLYALSAGDAGRVASPSDRTGPGTGLLPMNLRYLLTAHGPEGGGVVEHRVLGAAMRALHDRPVLSGPELDDAVGDGLSGRLQQVRLTPVARTLEELATVWTALRTPMRLSLAYEASVLPVAAGSAPPRPED